MDDKQKRELSQLADVTNDFLHEHNKYSDSEFKRYNEGIKEYMENPAGLKKYLRKKKTSKAKSKRKTTKKTKDCGCK